MPLYFACAWYALEVCLIRASIPKGLCRLHLQYIHLRALHAFAFKIHLPVKLLAIPRNTGDVVRPEITCRTCTTLSTADVY